MMQLVAVDFDGTVVRHAYPEIGEDVDGAVRVLHRLIESGTKLILWTMRSGEYLEDAVTWFGDRGIYLWGVNENPDQHVWTDSRKVYAPLYIDDAALGCPLLRDDEETRPYVDWLHVEIELEKRGYLPRRELMAAGNGAGA